MAEWTKPNSLFKTFLGQVDHMVDNVREDWCCHKEEPDNGVMNVEVTKEFYRFWSCIEVEWNWLMTFLIV